uniref:Uncharacterized protein n=1 Tax=Spironucleus salmonicida TaxID=348837 RepID=V6LP16_9EUKA|eukprot:EST42474.1 Hypothetical protein SS50377_17780 [Spironucleus salmonicida]
MKVPSKKIVETFKMLQAGKLARYTYDADDTISAKLYKLDILNEFSIVESGTLATISKSFCAAWTCWITIARTRLNICMMTSATTSPPRSTAATRQPVWYTSSLSVAKAATSLLIPTRFASSEPG